MFQIRPEQEQPLGAAAFDRWVRLHARKCFPAQCDELGEQELEAFLDATVQRALGHGFTDSLHQARFVDLSFVLGEAFEQDPAHPWAQQILEDPTLEDPEARITALHAAAVDHLRTAAQAR